MIALLPVFVVLVAFILYFYFSRWREQRLRSKPLPAEWLTIVAAAVPVYSSLLQPEKSKLQQLIQLFIAKKRFYGCGGLTITDEMRVTIAAEACLLLLNKGWSVYPKLSSVLVYPSAFRVERDQHQRMAPLLRFTQPAWGVMGHGRVILSWDDVEHGVSDFTDGHNVVLHEFAHQLDAESGSTNGAPPLRRNSYKSWATIFSENFEDLRERSMHRHKTVMDEYGTTNPAEFFAVATETFFEKPHQLFKKRPELYEELSQYYQLDPRNLAPVGRHTTARTWAPGRCVKATTYCARPLSSVACF